MSYNRQSNFAAKREWSLSAAIIALIASLALAVTLLSKPSAVLMGHTVVITQGVLAPALIVGAMLWATIEVFTGPGKSMWTAIIRSLIGFILGLFIGGFLGYAFQFGQYILVPAYAGNMWAILDLVLITIYALVVTWHAAWAHNKQYVRF